MQRLVPVEAAEPIVPQSGGSSALRNTVYTLLALMLLAGLWVRFNAQIAAVAPALAGPAASVADNLADSAHVGGLFQLGLLPASEAKAAVAEMGLPPGDAAALIDALQRKRLRLAHLPLIDDSLALSPGGHPVVVSSGGYTRQVMLTRTATMVTLPVGPVGVVSFSTPDPGKVGIVGLTLAGPVRLPDLQAGQVVSAGIIAQ
jgi:hypothetical protein